MSREIKFRGWINGYKRFAEAVEVHSDGSWNYDFKVGGNFEYGVDKGGDRLSQFTGVHDRDGKAIYEGDILNICFTSDSGEFIHDGIYTANIDTFNGVNFRFNDLSWIDHGHNQYPMNMDLNSSNKLGSVYAESGNKRFLYAADQYASDCEKPNSYPFNDEKELKFHSRYFKIIGNIYEHSHLLEG